MSSLGLICQVKLLVGLYQNPLDPLATRMGGSFTEEMETSLLLRSLVKGPGRGDGNISSIKVHWQGILGEEMDLKSPSRS
jgi:hypothetical protein